MLEKYESLLEDRRDIGQLATFVPNKKMPVYSWIYYKEGFSRDLVFKLAEMFGLKSGQTILDPFCGSGTTLVACRELGISSIGLDVMPLAVFSSWVKTRNYDVEKLKESERVPLSARFERLKWNFPPLMKRAFSKYALEDIAFFMTEIKKIEDVKCRDFLLLALISAAIRASYAWKDGSSIKIRKARKPPLRFLLKRTAKRMTKDLDGFSSGSDCGVYQCDARRMDGIDDGSIDAIITSPPYLNQIDYTRVYEIENFFIKDLYQKPPLRSYIGLETDVQMPGMDLPPAAAAYFHDMQAALKEMHRVCKAGAKIALVVGNAYFPGRIMDSDLTISKLAEDVGFSVEKIMVLNTRFALEERTEKKGILRESMIIMRK